MRFISEADGDYSVELDPEDTWNMHYTLAVLIVPMLKQLRKTAHGGPLVADEDVPEHLRAGKVDKYEVDDNWFTRWDWVLTEMIYAFTEIARDDFKHLGDNKYHNRIDNGLRLFGKYYRDLWD